MIYDLELPAPPFVPQSSKVDASGRRFTTGGRRPGRNRIADRLKSARPNLKCKRKRQQLQARIYLQRSASENIRCF